MNSHFEGLRIKTPNFFSHQWKRVTQWTSEDFISARVLIQTLSAQCTHEHLKPCQSHDTTDKNLSKLLCNSFSVRKTVFFFLLLWVSHFYEFIVLFYSCSFRFGILVKKKIVDSIRKRYFLALSNVKKHTNNK